MCIHTLPKHTDTVNFLIAWIWVQWCTQQSEGRSRLISICSRPARGNTAEPFLKGHGKGWSCSSISRVLHMCEALDFSPEPHKLGIVIYTWNLSTWETKIRDQLSRAEEGNPDLHRNKQNFPVLWNFITTQRVCAWPVLKCQFITWPRNWVHHLMLRIENS